MKSYRAVPTPLSLVSYLFLIMAIMDAVEMLGGFTKGSFRFDFGILSFGIFFGLRRYSPGWRTCALVFIWFALIGLPIAFAYGIFGSDPAFIKFFGQRYEDIPVFWVSVFAAVTFPLELWMYRVLTRPDIRCMFYDEPQTPVI